MTPLALLLSAGGFALGVAAGVGFGVRWAELARGQGFKAGWDAAVEFCRRGCG